MVNQIPFDEQTNKSIHQVVLTIAWALLINICLIVIQFKSKKISFTIHFILGVLVIALTLLGSLIYLLEHGIKLKHKTWYKYTHNVIGFIIFCVILLQGFLGYIIKRSQQKQFISIDNMKKIKVLHKIFGYTLIILAKFSYLIRYYVDHWQFTPLIIFQGICLVIFIIIKARSKNLISKEIQFRLVIDRKITDIRQLEYFSQFFILANRIYSLLSVNFHPGGVQIINILKGRQIDRFLYGGAGPQNSPDIIFQHPIQSLSILKSPIAYLDLNRPYVNMRQINSCKLISSTLLKNGQTFLIKLAFRQTLQDIRFLGYSKYEQFGYYHSLSLNGKVTRLYTGVNCLRTQNISRIKQIYNLMNLNCDINLQSQAQIPNVKKNKQSANEDNKQNFLNQALLKCQADSLNQQFYVPFLIKKYQNGKLTSKLFGKRSTKKQLSIQLSQPLGRGLGLELLNKGKIVFLAGGTGLFPFIDLIDILFKKDLINRQYLGSNNLKNFDSILNNKSEVENFQYLLILTLRKLSDIHPLTLFQINHLCGQKSTIKFRCKLNCPESISKQENKDFHMHQSQDIIKDTIKQLKSQNFKKLYICGPPSLQKQTIIQLNTHKIPNEHYQFV